MITVPFYRNRVLTEGGCPFIHTNRKLIMIYFSTNLCQLAKNNHVDQVQNVAETKGQK